MTDAPTLLLDAAEARVLGCLVEKEATTPEQYPLTENAALQAANQKTSREPVMALESGEVARALRGLEAKALARRVDGARALRFEARLLQDGAELTLPLAEAGFHGTQLTLDLRGPEALRERWGP